MPGKWRKVGNYGRYITMGNETKYLDIAFQDTDLDGIQTSTLPVETNKQGATTTATDRTLSAVAQGTSFNQRIGQKICMKSLDLNILWDSKKWESTAGVNDVNAQLVVAVVLDHQANGAVPTWADIFQNPNDTGAGNGALPMVSMWFRRKDRPTRFTVLARRIYTPTAGLPVQIHNDGTNNEKRYFTGTAHRPIKLHFNLKNTVVEYDGTTGAVTEQCCNTLMVFLGLVDPNNNGVGAAEVRMVGRLNYIG